MSREICYILMDPTKNMTILVETPVPPESQPSVAARLMEQEPAAEQVGFLSAAGSTGHFGSTSAASRPDAEDRPAQCAVSLRMAGGEFCGNAAMSAAAYYSMCAGITEGQVSVQVSGTPAPVTVNIRRDENGTVTSRRAAVHMPHPVSVETISFPEGQILPVVTFPGISHVIVDKTDILFGKKTLKDPAADMDRETAEEYARRWCSFLGTDALGLMFLNERESRLTPLVYVPAADTLFWESACASGTAAVGTWMAEKTGRPVALSLRQPGGILKISTTPDGTLLLEGTIHCCYKKTVLL